MRPVTLALFLAFSFRIASAQIWFEPNRGQTAADVLFLGHSKAGTLLLKTRGATLRTADGGEIGITPELLSATPQVTAEDATGAVSNYLIGSDAARWIHRVPQYARVRYHGIRPGVDLIFHGDSQALEYDLVIAPAADPASVRLRYDGARRLALDASGDLVIFTRTGQLRQKRPVVYQEVAGVRREVTGSFLVEGRSVAFQVGSYDRTKPLVIDPVLVYGTYLGGLSKDLGNGVAVDATGSAYVVGATVSADFPTTGNVVQAKHEGLPDSGVSSVGGGRVYDVFVAKFSPDGSKLVYSTFLGGSGSDQGLAIAVDTSGSVVVAGSTGSPNFPLTAGAIQKTPPPFGVSGFVAKLKADGSDLVYSSYVGTGGNTIVRALAMDSAGAVYLAGAADSHGFVTKLNSAGTSQVYSMPIAGSGSDAVLALAVNTSGNAWITGSTTSTDFPVTAGAAQKTHGGGTIDAFVAELNPGGTAFTYATYMGGSGSDTGNAIALSSDGSVTVAGNTASANFPVSTGAFQTALMAASSGLFDAFVVRLDLSGAVQYSTLLGGTSLDSATAVAAAVDGSAIVTGRTQSLDFPLTPDAYQTRLTGSNCQDVSSIIPVTGSFPPCDRVFLTIVHVSGRRLVYSTYLGGSDHDLPGGLAMGADGAVYIAGSAASTDFPTTRGAYRTQKKANTCVDINSPSFSVSYACEDAFLLKIDPATAGPVRPVAAVANGTNGVTGPIAPGEFVSLFGFGIGPQTAAGAQLDSKGFLTTTLSGTTVTFNDIPAPLLYVGLNQINAIVPFGVAGKASATIRIDTPAYAQNVAAVPVTMVAPGLVSMSGTGQDQAAALNQDGSINSSTNPAARGSIVVLYGSGAGPTSPPGIDGHIANSPAPSPIAPITVTIGGAEATVLYAGGAPGLVEGVIQVNAVIPAGVIPGARVPVVIASGTAKSQPLLTIAVK
jgi:uncharacterized protein (TIGR03437 family)